MQIYYKYSNNKNILTKKRCHAASLYQQIKLNNSFQEESEEEL